LIFFNDPLPCPDPAHRAVRLAVELREAMRSLQASWLSEGYELGFGAGITFGHATLGQVGLETHFEYEPNGAVVNLAARLCGEARDGQILISQRVLAAVGDSIEVEPAGELLLKGIGRRVPAYNIVALHTSSPTSARSGRAPGGY